MENAALLALVAAFCFALALILQQFGLRHMPVWRAPLYSIGGSVVLALVTAPVFVDFSRLDSRAVAIFAAVGCIFPVAVSILTVRGNEALGPAVSGAAANVTPLFAVLGAVFFLGERLSLAQAAGLALVVGGVAVLALRGGTANRQWPVWVLAYPLGAALVRGAIQPAIKTGLALWHEPLAAALIGYVTSLVVILVAVGARARREGPADRRGVAWFLAVGATNGTATLLLYAALGLGSIALVAPLVATYPLMAWGMSAMVLRGERLGPAAMAGVIVTVLGVVLLLAGRAEAQAPSREPPNPACAVKGNSSKKINERIYHVPGYYNYNDTIIEPSRGERWFCSEREAIEAGWRKALNCLRPPGPRAWLPSTAEGVPT